jgi:hypothetical protein
MNLFSVPADAPARPVDESGPFMLLIKPVVRGIHKQVTAVPNGIESSTVIPGGG